MAHVEPGDARDEMREDCRGEEPCRPSDRGLCRTHPTCEHVQKVLRDQDAELKARREILDAVCAAAGEGNCWLSAATIDWRQRLRDFAEDSERHQLAREEWDADHKTFPGVVLYVVDGFYVAYHIDANHVWQDADDDRPVFHVMAKSDPPHRAVIHPLHLNAWVQHFAEIHLPVSFVSPGE